MVDSLKETTRVTILYGSQTGNAEDMSKRLGYQAKALGYNVIVESMDDFCLPQLAKQKVVIFVCSTTGHGQEPENMKNFYNFIRRRDLPQDCLNNLHFAVYGLGDSSYAKFNYVSKILYKRLINCGAKPIHELVKGDEQHYLGCDGIIYPQLDILWSRLNSSNKQTFDNFSKEASKESSYDLIINRCDTQPMDFVFKRSYFSQYNIITATCFRNERLTPKSHFQDTRLLCFKCTEDINYEAGDVCSILPENSQDNVEKFLNLLNLNPDDRICVKKKDPDYMINYLYDFIPDGLRMYDLVKFYLDIQSVPRRSFFEYFWKFSDNDLERDKLKEFATTEGQEEMYEYCVQPKRSILEVMADFPHTIKNLTINYILDMIPPIKPRSFSIASSNKVHPNEIHLIVGVVKYQTRMRKTRLGLCSTYLSKLEPVKFIDESQKNHKESQIRFFIKKTSFKLPSNLDTPVVMIGPGLGIAPFKSFIEDLSAKVNQNIQDKEIRILYFGCRFSDKDFYFEEELKGYAKKGLYKLRCAFSREGAKQRVQDLILEDVDQFRELVLNKQAVIYVAGNSKLPDDLRKLFSKILSQSTHDVESEEISRYVLELETSNRIQYDCW